MATACASLALMGCSISNNKPGPPPDAPSDGRAVAGGQLGRCFDTPQSAPRRAAIPRTPSLTLHYNASKRKIIEAPVIKPPIQRRLAAGNVRINAGGFYGSGFITTAPDGDEVVITNAHVVAVNNLEQISVTGAGDDTVDIARGCYIYDNNGTFANLANDYQSLVGSIQDVDIAVLRLERPLTHGKPLSVARSAPGRGTWLTFVNNQGTHTPDTPAVYQGLTVSTLPARSGNCALTGLEPWRGPENETTVQHGASGGLTANTVTGEVAGIITGRNPNPMGPAELSLYGITVQAPTGSNTALPAESTIMMGADTIRLALSSSNY